MALVLSRLMLANRDIFVYKPLHIFCNILEALWMIFFSVKLVFHILLADSVALLLPSPLLIASTASPGALVKNRNLCQAQAILWNWLAYFNTTLVTVLVWER